MTIRLYANGTGGTLGDELITETELYASGIVYFVHHSGDNANSGQMRGKPWASLVYAKTQVSDNDIIVLMDGHTESITSKQTIATNGLKIVGEGSSNGTPTVTLNLDVSNDNVMVLSGTNIALANINFPAVAPIVTARVGVTGARSMVRGCRFEVGAGDQDAPLRWAADGARLFDTTIVNVSTTTQPAAALTMDSPADCEIEACTIDAGTVGFGFSGIAGSTPARIRMQQMRLLNGAGILFDDGTTGYVSISERTGAPIVTGLGKRLPSGFGQIGDPILADGEFYYTGSIYYAHYGTGSDGNSGLSELAPKKTIMGAVTTSFDDCDIIVCLPGHEEPLTNSIVPNNAGQTIIGCGQSGGSPSCRVWIENGGELSGLAAININSSNAYIRNIWVDYSHDSNGEYLVILDRDYCELRGCLVTPGSLDTTGAIHSIDSKETIRETTVRPASGSPPYGIFIDVSTDVDLRGVVLSNGSTGWATLALNVDGIVTRLYGISMSQLIGADAFINASTTGLFNPETSSGSARVEW